jgi:hypothetical protein
VTFKLEDDGVLLSERAHKQMERWGAHLVVGNVVATRRKYGHNIYRYRYRYRI